MGTPFDFPATPTVGQKWPATPISGIPTYMWNGVTWTTLGATVAPPPGGTFTGLPEAPVDSKQYARKNAAWAEVAIPTNLITDAPADGRLFGRKDATWMEVIAGSGGGGGGGGIGEAPIDGTSYARKNAGWAPVTSGTPGPAGPPTTVIYVGSFL